MNSPGDIIFGADGEKLRVVSVTPINSPTQGRNRYGHAVNTGERVRYTAIKVEPVNNPRSNHATADRSK